MCFEIVIVLAWYTMRQQCLVELFTSLRNNFNPTFKLHFQIGNLQFNYTLVIIPDEDHQNVIYSKVRSLIKHRCLIRALLMCEYLTSPRNAYEHILVHMINTCSEIVNNYHTCSVTKILVWEPCLLHSAIYCVSRISCRSVW